MGIPTTVIMPHIAPLAKQQKCRAFGANTVIEGGNIGESKEIAETDPRFEGMQYINGYNDPEIIAGAGTMGLEIIEQLPDADYVVIPTGGAGLLAGTALAVKTLHPTCTIVAVEPEACPSVCKMIQKS